MDKIENDHENENAAAEPSNHRMPWTPPEFETIDMRLVRASNNANFDSAPGFTVVQS